MTGAGRRSSEPASGDARPGRRGLRRLGLVLVCLVALVLFGTRWGDRSLFPATAGDTVPVLYVSNGFHAGLLVPVPALRDGAARTGLPPVGAIAQRFAAYDWVELGWGDEGFYRETPTVADIDWRLGLTALLGLGSGSVLHVVGVLGDPLRVFTQGGTVALTLSQAGFDALIRRLGTTVARAPDGAPIELGPGLYGPSLFYRATDRFFFGHVCNHWIADLLDAAGVPVSPLLATIPRGLGWDLAWRSGLAREAPAALPDPGRTQ